jgi:hypothetical protein
MEQVEEFVENHVTKKGEKLKDSTKGEYRNAFSMFKEKFGTEDFKTLFTNDYQNIFDKLKEEYKSDYYINKVNGFCLYYSIPYTIPTIIKEKSKKIVQNIDNIRDAIRKINDRKAKLFLTISTDTSGEMLRRDWANTMIKEYTSEEEHSTALSLYSIETGVFTTEEDNKTYRPRELKLSEYAHSMIKDYIETLEDKKFLFVTKSIGKKDRCGVYGKYISGITKKYLGENINTNAFRSAVSTQEYERIIENGGDIDELYESAHKRGHSLDTEMRHYIGFVKDKEQKPKIPEKYHTDAIRLFEGGKSIDEIVEFFQLLG